MSLFFIFLKNYRSTEWVEESNFIYKNTENQTGSSTRRAPHRGARRGADGGVRPPAERPNSAHGPPGRRRGALGSSELRSSGLLPAAGSSSLLAAVMSRTHRKHVRVPPPLDYPDPAPNLHRPLGHPNLHWVTLTSTGSP